MKTTTVKFLGETITISELTVAQLDDVLGSDSMTTLDKVFDGEVVSQKMIELSTGLTSESLSASHPSDVRILIDACKEVNPDFLSGMASLLSRAKRP